MPTFEVAVVTASDKSPIAEALDGKASTAGGDPAPVDGKTRPSLPVAIATGSPDAS